MEIIYVLINEAMPGYVKIGRTSNDLDRRIKELSSSTSIPLPFTCFYARTVSDAAKVENLLHRAFGNKRVNPKREFFLADPSKVVEDLQLLKIEDVTPTHELIEDAADRAALTAISRRRDRFRFSQAKIPVGATLRFARDKSITATVIDDHQIELNGKTTSLSQSAKDLLGYRYGVQGTVYWLYKGETLDARRRQTQ